MGAKVLRILKKNLLAIITIAISMGVLLYFLFTTDGITALGHLASSLRWEWLLVTLGAMVGGWLLETYVLGASVSGMEIFAVLSCCNDRPALQRIDAVCNRWAADANVFNEQNGCGYRQSRVDCSDENAGLSGNHGHLCHGDGCIPLGIFSAECQ